MAVYKLFPYKDATLYSFYPDMNTGIDPITTISNLNFAVSSNPQVARFLTEFVQSEIVDVINNKINGAQWDVDFRSYIATAQGVVEATDISVHPLAQSWFNGTGTYLDVPQTTDGCSWNSPDFKNSGVAWSSSGTDSTNHYVTSSFNPLLSPQGGGAWYYSGSDGTEYEVTQSFDTRSTKDLKVNAKTVCSLWYSASLGVHSSASLPNYGFITKWENSVEFNTNTQIQPVMQFYSVDTNTIYPPQLEFKWRDYSSVLTGSATASIVNTTNLISSLADNPGTFTPESINRFRFNVAPKYPIKVYTTESQFTGTNYLPTSSCYAIKDLDTNEYVVDYDTIFTQLSSDSEGNYFDVYMNGLEPERYYKICIKTNINGSTLILDDNYYFKVVNSY
tara:strand:- start:1870 stop:3042 length:1173 start_codon:yes stop_codon:yes gene_type:complete